MTQNQKILLCILHNNSIDTRRATIAYILSLTKRISELRQMGYDIPDEYIKTVNGKRYKLYRLSEADRERVRTVFGDGI